MDLEPGLSSVLPPFLLALTSYSICHSPAHVHSIKFDQRLADQFPPGLHCCSVCLRQTLGVSYASLSVSELGEMGGWGGGEGSWCLLTMRNTFTIHRGAFTDLYDL